MHNEDKNQSIHVYPFLPIHLSNCRNNMYRCASIHPSTHPPIHASTHPPIHPSAHPPLHPSTDPPIHQNTHPPIHPATHPPIHPPTHPPTHPPSHLNPSATVDCSCYAYAYDSVSVVASWCPCVRMQRFRQRLKVARAFFDTDMYLVCRSCVVRYCR